MDSGSAALENAPATVKVGRQLGQPGPGLRGLSQNVLLQAVHERMEIRTPSARLFGQRAGGLLRLVFYLGTHLLDGLRTIAMRLVQVLPESVKSVTKGGHCSFLSILTANVGGRLAAQGATTRTAIGSQQPFLVVILLGHLHFGMR